MSTIAIYGNVSGDVSEDTPAVRTGSEYGDSKIEAERLCREYMQAGVPLTILRPTIVYGPFSESWTVEFVQRLRSGRWLIPREQSNGICNLLYVDDLVAATLRALERPEAVGEAFNVNGGERVTWYQYFEVLNDAMGLATLTPKSSVYSRSAAWAMMPVRKTAKLLLQRFEAPIMALYQRSAAAKRLMRLAEHAIRTTPTTAEFRLYSRQAYFRTDKAERLLGFDPLFSMREGIALSMAWLRHHRYV
jgi:nucleoside-diphosphate-sugar epimerase